MRHATDLAGITLGITTILLLVTCGYAWGVATSEAPKVCVVTPNGDGYIFVEAVQ